MPQDTRGGARKGAGRKPRGLASSGSRLQVRVTASERATLRERSAGRGLSESEAIRTALRVDGLID